MESLTAETPRDVHTTPFTIQAGMAGRNILKFLDSIPLTMIIVVAVMLGLAPLFPEPHLIEKIRMLTNGNLTKPIDIFDLLLHSSGIMLLILKLARMAQIWQQEANEK